MDAFVTPIGCVAQATTASRPPALVSRGECRRLSGSAPVVKQKLIAVPLAGPDRRLGGTKTRRAAILGRMAARSWCFKRKRVVAGQVKLRSGQAEVGKARARSSQVSRSKSEPKGKSFKRRAAPRGSEPRQEKAKKKRSEPRSVRRRTTANRCSPQRRVMVVWA